MVVAAGCARDARDGGDQRALVESADGVAQAVERAVPRGLDSVLLAQAFDSATRLPRLRSLLVARHGELVREQYFHGATAEGRANIKSASKSILSALVGIAIAEGHLEGVDQPIAPLFAAYAAANADPRIDRVTVGNLLSIRRDSSRRPSATTVGG